MQVIFSRKGFDSDAGGCPSPIFPDDSMIALPIPDSTNRVRYADLEWRGRNLGQVVEALDGSDADASDSAHLDPDLRAEIAPRPPRWRPSFGQTGKAQGHLRNQRVGAGDLFLFFGLFRRVDTQLRWIGPKMHVLWGWMQVDDVVPVDLVRSDQTGDWDWAKNHPHVAHEPGPDDMLYVGSRTLQVPGADGREISGTGTFDAFDSRLRLTAEGKSVSRWSVPKWLIPNGRKPLSFHGNPARWSCTEAAVELKTVGRGQEFVLDAEDYPQIWPWVLELIRGQRA